MSVGSNQIILVDYKDNVNSNEVNDRLLSELPVGIIEGGYLTKVDNVTVTLSTLLCEISDGNHQIRIQTTATNNITVSNVNVYVCLRWSYVATTGNLMTFVATATPATNDLIVGKCTFSGATLTGFDYTLRSGVNSFSKFLLVEPTETASMQLRVRQGYTGNSTQTFTIIDQLTSSFVAPVTNPRIDVVAVNSSGTVTIIAGTEAASPVAPSYGGKIPLAEVTLTVGQVSITSSSIKDVRPYINNASSFITLGDTPTSYTGQAGKVPVVNAGETALVFTNLLPAGAYFPFAGSVLPSGYLWCDGSAVSRVTYATLFAAIGTTWGSGDGLTTFNLPNTAGNTLVGYKSGDPTFGTIAQVQGEKTHTLTSDEMPTHNHALQGNVALNLSGPIGLYGGNPGNDTNHTATNTASTGGNGAHNNIQPSLTTQFIIKY